MASYAEIVEDISKGKFDPVYFLQGKETFFIDDIIARIEHGALDETQKSFNQIVQYGKETDLTQLLGVARRYPMMGERQVVIVKEAQEMKGWTSEEGQALLNNYLENPLESTVLVFGYKYKSMDKRTKVGKILEKQATFLNAKELYDNEVPGWVQSYCRAKQVPISNEAVMMLTEHIGNNLQRLANEIDKLQLNLKEGQEVTVEMIQKYVGISKEYNIFELQKAIGLGNKAKAFRIVNYFASNPSANPMVLTIYSLFTYFSKLLLIHHSGGNNERAVASTIGVNPYFVKEYIAASRNYSLSKVVQNISHLQQADLESKGFNAASKKDGAVLTELVHKLMS